MKTNKKLEQIAIIDIGAHSIRMDIYQFRLGNLESPELFESISREINLGEDVFKRGYITSTNMNMICEILESFSNHLKEYAITNCRAFATSAMREALNHDIVLDRIKMISGIDVDIIEGQEEGKLLYCATSYMLKKNNLFPKKQGLIFFIGTGSLIVMFVNNGELQFSETSTLGSMRLLDEYGSGKIKPQNIRDILKSFEFEERLEAVANFNKNVPLEIIAVGAGIRAVEDMSIFNDVRTSEDINIVSSEKIAEINDFLIHKRALDLVSEYGLAEHVALSSISSFCILNYFLKEFNVSSVILSKMNTRLAYMLNIIDNKIQLTFDKDLITTLVNIGKKYKFDYDHAQLVANISLKVFDKLKRAYNMTPRERIILECAALLHDIGRYVDVRQHHKHSFYLISNSHIPGLSEQDLHLVATIARYHRKSAPKNGHFEYDKCPRADRVSLQKLAAIVRVADSIAVGNAKKYDKLSVHFIDKVLIFRNRRAKDMLWESLYLAKKGDLFRDIFGVKIKFEEEGGKI